MLCALQETRRDGFLSTTTKNFQIYCFGECAGRNGVGIAVHKQYMHLVSESRGVPDSDGRIMSAKVKLQDSKQPVTMICGYLPTNTSSLVSSEKFYSQVRELMTPNTRCLGPHFRPSHAYAVYYSLLCNT